MTRAAVSVLAVLAIACWTTAKPPSVRAVPGLVWITPEEPWHLPVDPRAIAVDGATAMLAGRHGWIARLDLATGLVIRERRIGTTLFEDLVKLSDGRWLAVGADQDRVVAFTLDAKTFEARPIVLGAVKDKNYATIQAALLADGSVAIAARGLPLAIYDPVTWEIRTVLDPELGWAQPQVVGNVLYANRASNVYRFDLATGKRTELGNATESVASQGPIAAQIRDSDRWFVELWNGADKQRIPSSSSIAVAIEPSGKRLAIVDTGVLTIYELPSRNVSAQFDVGSSNFGARIVFDGAGDRVIVASETLVRTIDLARKTMSPLGAPPVGMISQLTVGADGQVLAHGVSAWRLVDGKVTATGPLAGSDLASVPGELVRYAALDHTDAERPKLVARALAPDAAIRTWRVPQPAYLGWVAASGGIAVETLSGNNLGAGILRDDGDRLVRMASISNEANVRDVDLDRGLALVDLKGTVHVLRLADKQLLPVTFRSPQCDPWGKAELERDGGRVVSFNSDAVIVWERATGAMLGSLALDAVGQAIFVHGHDELVVVDGTNLVLWSLRARELRTLPLQLSFLASVSPDGRRLAIGFASGRVALIDLDVLRAGLPVTSVAPAKVPTACGKGDPLAIDSAYRSRDPVDDP